MTDMHQILAGMNELNERVENAKARATEVGRLAQAPHTFFSHAPCTCVYTILAQRRVRGLLARNPGCPRLLWRTLSTLSWTLPIRCTTL